MDISSSASAFGNLSLGFFILQSIAIGFLPLYFGFSGLVLCSLGSITYGAYALALPGRIIYRLEPRVVAGTELCCIRDMIRAWAMFCIALGTMGLAICLDESLPSSRLHGRACLIFIAVALSSILWDVHLLRSKHWGAERFLLVNISANAAICIAAISSLVVEN